MEKKIFTSTTVLQSAIEHPVVVMMAAGSSAEDQTALLQDRIDSVATMSHPIAAKEAVIEDKTLYLSENI